MAAAQVTAVFAQYQAAAAGGGPVERDLARRMDGALLSVGALSDILKSKVLKKIRNNFFGFSKRHSASVWFQGAA